MELGEYEDPTVTTTAAPANCSTAPPARRSHTAVPAEKLRALNEELLRTPEGFNVHRKLRSPLSKRLDAIEQGGIEFGHAEALAFASLLTEGVHIRLTGQDTERGTFSHRHLVLHDENTGLEYCPMQNLEDATRPLRALQQPALGDRLPRLRVRLLGGQRRTRWSSGRRSSATSPTPAR